MLGLFGKAKKEETWSDRAKAHRSSLRDTQVAENERAAAKKAGRTPRESRPASARKGFGKRATE